MHEHQIHVTGLELVQRLLDRVFRFVGLGGDNHLLSRHLAQCRGDVRVGTVVIGRVLEADAPFKCLNQ